MTPESIAFIKEFGFPVFVSVILLLAGLKYIQSDKKDTGDRINGLEAELLKLKQAGDLAAREREDKFRDREMKFIEVMQQYGEQRRQDAEQHKRDMDIIQRITDQMQTMSTCIDDIKDTVSHWADRRMAEVRERK